MDVDVVRLVADMVRTCDMEVRRPVTLRSTNNVVVWFSPSPVVAKISREYRSAGRELAIVRELVSLGAPVVPPLDLGISQPVRIGDRTVTFWHYEPQDTAVTSTADQIADALFLLHKRLALTQERQGLASVTEQLTSAIRSLERSDFAPRLVGVDRALLHEALSDGIDRLEATPGRGPVIHGSPHRFNILTVNHAPQFIDFETVGFGPLEWDLAHLEPEVANHYPDMLDQPALALCRVLVSAATSTWCWDGLDRGSDMRSHALAHLEVVRSARAERGGTSASTT